jgi:hypothetical protein
MNAIPAVEFLTFPAYALNGNLLAAFHSEGDRDQFLETYVNGRGERLARTTPEAVPAARVVLIGDSSTGLVHRAYVVGGHARGQGAAAVAQCSAMGNLRRTYLRNVRKKDEVGQVNGCAKCFPALAHPEHYITADPAAN